MCIAVCGPFLNNVAILVQQLHDCTLDVIAVRIYLAERYAGGLVVHLNVCDRSVCVHCKCDIFGDRPAVGGGNFTECVSFACGQNSFDQMCFAGRDPFFNDVAVLVDDLQRCSRQFLTAGQIILGDRYLGGIVLHVDLGDGAVCVHRKLLILCQHIASRSIGFV